MAARDGRQGGFVTGEEVPVRVGCRVVGAAGARERQGVAGLGGGRPGPGQPLVAVDHKVDGEFLGFQVHPADRVGPGVRPLLARHGFADGPQIQRLGVVDAGLRERQS